MFPRISRYRSIVELEAPGFRRNQSTDKLRQRAEEKERTREALQQQSGGRPGVINRMQFTFSVDQPAQSTPASAQHVKKPDLKPSSQFRDSVGRRARPTTRASINGHGHGANNVEGSKDRSDKAGDKDPPSLTQMGCRRSPSNSANNTSDDATLHDSDSESQRTAANQSATTYSSSNWGDSGVSLRFPSFFSSDFGPSALLFPQPSLITPLSYGDDTSAHGTIGERFVIARPTIEIPLDRLSMV